MKQRVVLALGGNALQKNGEATAEAQKKIDAYTPPQTAKSRNDRLAFNDFMFIRELNKGSFSKEQLGNLYEQIYPGKAGKFNDVIVPAAVKIPEAKSRESVAEKSKTQKKTLNASIREFQKPKKMMQVLQETSKASETNGQVSQKSKRTLKTNDICSLKNNNDRQ